MAQLFFKFHLFGSVDATGAWGWMAAASSFFMLLFYVCFRWSKLSGVSYTSNNDG
jgi:hypothetical protein